MQTIASLRKQLDNKEVSALELLEAALARVTATKELNTYITVAADHARARAKAAQKDIDAGRHSLLTGIPYAAKDEFCTKGIETTAGSKILQGYIPPYSATAIERLGDAVLIGKTNQDEFACGSSSEHSAFGPVKNPYDLTRVPGGSSGGSAVTVASGDVPLALGTDTGGSVRLPAGFCNVVGFKPTYGRIPRYGVIAMASSLDTVGMFTNTVQDAALVLQQLAGPDQFDSTSPDVPVDDYAAGLQQSIKGLKIGIPKEYMDVAGLDPDMRAMVEAAAKTLADLGAQLVDVSLPHTKYGLPTYYLLCPSEVASNMARYDGIQFGPRAEGSTLDEVFYNTRALFGAEVKRRIMIGTFTLSAGYVDAYYKKAQAVRSLVIQDFRNSFAQVDVILTPSSPTPPFVIGDRQMDPVAMYAADIYTVCPALAGIPGIVVPGGVVGGLPAGVQLLAPQFAEKRLLNVAHQFEQARGPIDLQLAM